MKAKQQTRMGQLPQVLVVHINKYAHCDGPTIGASMRVSGTDLKRIAVVHHAGYTPASGHYTSTVATQGSQTYHCNDRHIALQPNLDARQWENGYLIFLQVDKDCDTQHSASWQMLVSALTTTVTGGTPLHTASAIHILQQKLCQSLCCTT